MARSDTDPRSIASAGSVMTALLCLLSACSFGAGAAEPRVRAREIPVEPSAAAHAGDPGAVLDAFKEWVERYFSETSPQSRGILEPVGRQLALQRREALGELIRRDPQAALHQALGKDAKERLPDSVARYLEDHVCGRGTFIVSHGCGPDGHQIQRQVLYEGRTYEAFVYGRGREQTSRPDVWIDGIAAGNRMAVKESCLRGEPVAGAIDAAAPAWPAMRHGRSLGRPWTTGTKTVLYMRLDYPDAPGATISLPAAQQLMSESSDFYAANTYGRIPSLPTTVTPVLRMPSLYAAYTSREEVEQDATTVGRAAGFDPDDYDLVVYQNTPGQVMSGKWGWARENAKGVWMYQGFVWMHHCHEFGHNFGNRHANLWDTYGEDPMGPGENLEYGDVFDNMGYRGDLGEGHHNPWFKNRQDWLDDADINTVTTNGVYRVQALEYAPSGNWMALKIPRDSSKNYWVFYRDQFPQSRDGAIVIWGYNKRVSAHLLDMTPGTAGGMNDAWDAPLLVGRTFTDWAANIQITVLGKGGTTPETLDIQVTVGPPNNVAPTVDAGAGQVVVLSGESVTTNLDGTVTDPDDTPITTWQAEGPVTFGDPGAVDTTATFFQAGAYGLSLGADDGTNLPVADAVDIIVVPPGAEGLLLTSPEGGETWTVGAPASVTWSSAGIANVRIELSRDGGTVWETLVSTTPASTGSWTWTDVSAPVSNRCLLRVADAGDGLPDSVSADFFTVGPPSCVPTVPGDFDCDGDVDLDDYAAFAACLWGPGIPLAPSSCGTFDFDADGDVDASDFGAFQVAFGGPA